MNKIIEDQLKKCSFADLKNFDEIKKEFFIKKRTTLRLNQDSCYIIKLQDSIIHPSPNSLLVTNWNNGNIPTNEYYKVDICQIMANMIRVNGIAYDITNNINLNNCFNGWLPISEIEVIAELE